MSASTDRQTDGQFYFGIPPTTFQAVRESVELNISTMISVDISSR